MAFGWLKDRLSDVADAAWDAATEVADTVVEAVGDVASVTGDVIGAVGAVADAATLGLASDVLHVVDNTVLDTVDTLTGGLVDVDYDGGNFSASVGVDGIAHVGASVGEDGVRHSASALDQGFDVGLTDAGLDASGHAGIDWGPLPYAGGSVRIDGDGDIAAEGTVQGTIPTPIGLLSGRAEAAFVRQGDLWAGELHADGTLRLPSGSVIAGGVDASYLETVDGSMLSVGVEGSFTSPGVGTVGGSLGYDRLEVGDVVAERFEAGAYASGYGAHVEVGVHGERVTTPAGSTSEWDASGDVSVPGLDGGSSGDAPPPMEIEPAPAPATEFDDALAAADEVEVSVDEMFSDLG